MRRKRLAQNNEDTGVDLTPMLDVVFIMLIFFIVTTSFVKEAGIEVSRPSAATAEKKDKASIFVGISESGDIWIDKRKIDIRSVRANIERLHAETPEGSIVVQADKGSKTGTLVKVMDQIRAAGVTAISVAATGGQ
ncbi:MAG: biopolymer transporter ExbD [Bacteriovoracaceae bacterium]|nr:biopolymer transporter ExbD [Bacteriovoracaceae bacterium]